MYFANEAHRMSEEYAKVADYAIDFAEGVIEKCRNGIDKAITNGYFVFCTHYTLRNTAIAQRVEYILKNYFAFFGYGVEIEHRDDDNYFVRISW